MKLTEIGVPAVRAVPSDKATFSSCVAGEYRFGNAYKVTHTNCDLVSTCTILVPNNACYTSVLMSPETAITAPWRVLFREKRIAVVAVDEAHCILEWFVDALCNVYY